MIFDLFSYVEQPEKTGSPEEDIRALYEHNNRQKTWRHVSDVAVVNGEIARQYGLDEGKCRLSALLHDIGAVIAPDDMLVFIESRGLALCEAERRHPFLLHQRVSRVIAEEYFSIEDPEILLPIQHHTTLREDATAYDMALFIADKLAWDQDGVPPFYDAVRTALDESLEAACLKYMDYMIDSGKLLYPHTDWTRAYRWLKEK